MHDDATKRERWGYESKLSCCHMKFAIDSPPIIGYSSTAPQGMNAKIFDKKQSAASYLIAVGFAYLDRSAPGYLTPASEKRACRGPRFRCSLTMTVCCAADHCATRHQRVATLCRLGLGLGLGLGHPRVTLGSRKGHPTVTQGSPLGEIG